MVAIVTALIVAAIATPFSFDEGFNGADLVVVLMLAIAAVLFFAPLIGAIGPDHPDGQTSLDIRDAERVDKSIH